MAGRRELQGVVYSNRGDKTITVLVSTKKAHPIYGKVVLSSKKYYAHDEENTCSIGDEVRISESRPLSKTKRWILEEIVRKADIV